jgi:glycerol kinase
MPRCVLALDQGTTSSRAILFDRRGRRLATAQEEFPQHFPEPGWVEHEPEGITNQRETTVVWNRETGEPVGHAIVWQDRRTAGFCDQMKRDGLEELIQKKTGLVIDAYFSGSKLRWILDNTFPARGPMRRRASWPSAPSIPG